MYLYLILCNILFIPIISGGSKKLDQNEAVTSVLPKVSSKAEENHNRNLTIITEGGTAVQSTPSVDSPKLNHTSTVLLSLDKELSKDNMTQSVSSKVVPRKGVVYQIDNATAVEDVSPKMNTTKSVKQESEFKVNSKDSTTSYISTTLSSDSGSKIKSNKTSSKPATEPTIPPKHKKPLLLSNEALDKMELNDNVRLPQVISSSKSILSDQLQSPNQAGVANKKIQSSNSNRHPGMVMPVVITILVVPMFAVLGYMALKRGKEAWKNRHYKRMDFLLDGMYNE